jgi:hypothetical protein
MIRNVNGQRRIAVFDHGSFENINRSERDRDEHENKSDAAFFILFPSRGILKLSCCPFCN